jgi:bifunctional ADP-heptose synthase (sugar kinase/adenylyltransferase)
MSDRHLATDLRIEAHTTAPAAASFVGPSFRSIVAALVARTRSRSASSSFSRPCRSSAGSKVGIITTSRLPHTRSDASQSATTARVAAYPVKVRDVSGAGDTVVAVLAPMHRRCAPPNAAAVVVGKRGTATVSAAELRPHSAASLAPEEKITFVSTTGIVQGRARRSRPDPFNAFSPTSGLPKIGFIWCPSRL